VLTRTVSFGLAALIAGAASSAQIGPAPLPTVDANLRELGKQPLHPFARDASGALLRTLFSGPGPADTTVTVEEVLVGPRASQKLPVLAGPSLVMWLEGHGTFAVGDKAAQTISNGFQVVPAGQALTIHNLGAPPISARIYEFTEK